MESFGELLPQRLYRQSQTLQTSRKHLHPSALYLDASDSDNFWPDITPLAQVSLTPCNYVSIPTSFTITPSPCLLVVTQLEAKSIITPVTAPSYTLQAIIQGIKLLPQFLPATVNTDWFVLFLRSRIEDRKVCFLHQEHMTSHQGDSMVWGQMEHWPLWKVESFRQSYKMWFVRKKRHRLVHNVFEKMLLLNDLLVQKANVKAALSN